MLWESIQTSQSPQALRRAQLVPAARMDLLPAWHLKEIPAWSGPLPKVRAELWPVLATHTLCLWPPNMSNIRKTE